jgi:Cu-Zn family superoxide dismutase
MKTFIFAAAALTLTACTTTSDPGGPSASVTLRPASGTKIAGNLTFAQVGGRVRVTGEITGHAPGTKGFHIHEKGDCSAPDAMSAGGHFNPAKTHHGAPGAGHAGDMGNLEFDASGKAVVNLMVSGISVSKEAPNGIIGRAVIVHVGTDDLKTDPTGNAGGRGACGVIG